MVILYFSRGVFLLANIKTNSLYLWYGSQSTAELQTNGRRLADWISQETPLEVGFEFGANIIVTQVEEGAEPMEFKTALRSNNRTRYDCLLNG